MKKLLTRENKTWSIRDGKTIEGIPLDAQIESVSSMLTIGQTLFKNYRDFSTEESLALDSYLRKKYVTLKK